MTSSLIRKHDGITVILMSRQLSKWKVFNVSLFLDVSYNGPHIIEQFFGMASAVSSFKKTIFQMIQEHSQGV